MSQIWQEEKPKPPKPVINKSCKESKEANKLLKGIFVLKIPDNEKH